MNQEKIRARLVGTGSALPERVLTNAELEKMVETSDEWIRTRTGISERRLAGEGEPSSLMGARAAEKALQEAALAADEVDLILACTMTPDYLAPNTAALIQVHLGADKAAAFDLNAACSGFVYGLATARAYVESGLARRVLVVASEKMSYLSDYSDRSTCILWGDGAGAAVVAGEGKGLAIRDTRLGACGKDAQLLRVPAGGSAMPTTPETLEQGLNYLHMAGKETFRHAVRYMEKMARECVEALGLTLDQVDWLVPHQANVRIMDAVGERLGIGRERVINTVYKYGNTSASAAAIALDELIRDQRLTAGQRVLLVVFGAGLTWGGALLEVVDE